MVRAFRQVPSVYFGRPGSLVTLPWPKGGLDKSYQRQTFDFLTGSGHHFVSLLAGGARTYTVHWSALHVDNYRLLDQYWSGQMGAGPWVMLDGSSPNLLMPNQAGAGSLYGDTTGFATSTGATNEGTLFVNSTATFLHRTGAPKSLQWQFTTAPITAPILKLSAPYRNWYGIPAFPGLSYAWSGWLRPDGTVDTSITASLRIRWLDAAGATISESSGTVTALTTFTQLSVIAVAPAGTFYAQPIVNVDGTTVTTGGSLYLDELVFEQDTVVNTWAPGTGVRAVEMLSLTDAVTFEARMRTPCDLVLQELAA